MVGSLWESMFWPLCSEDLGTKFKRDLKALAMPENSGFFWAKQQASRSKKWPLAKILKLIKCKPRP